MELTDIQRLKVWKAVGTDVRLDSRDIDTLASCIELNRELARRWQERVERYERLRRDMAYLVATMVGLTGVVVATSWGWL